MQDFTGRSPPTGAIWTSSDSHIPIVNGIRTAFNHCSEAAARQYGEPHNQGRIFFSVLTSSIDYYHSCTWAGDFQWSSYHVQLAQGKSTIFNNSQSTSTGSDAFVLGSGGSLQGSLNGTLAVGNYVLGYNITDQTNLGASSSSHGFERIDFGAPVSGPATVSEPSTWAFMGLGLLGLFLVSRRSA